VHALPQAPFEIASGDGRSAVSPPQTVQEALSLHLLDLVRLAQQELLMPSFSLRYRKDVLIYLILGA